MPESTCEHCQHGWKRQGKDAVNDVKVSCVGSRLQFWVNDTVLIDWEDDRLTEGEFGVAVTSLEGEFSEGAFDNFSATGTLAPVGAVNVTVCAGARVAVPVSASRCDHTLAPLRSSAITSPASVAT